MDKKIDSVEETLAIRNKPFPKKIAPRDVDITEARIARRKEYRKIKHKEYRNSAIGKEKCESRQREVKFEGLVFSQFKQEHPDVIEKLRKKYFTRRIDGLGSTEKI